MTLPESRVVILEWLKKGEHLPVKKIHFERVSFDNGDFSYEFGQHPIGFIAIYENNFEHRADARRFSEFIASSRNVTEHVEFYMESMQKRVAQLEGELLKRQSESYLKGILDSDDVSNRTEAVERAVYKARTQILEARVGKLREALEECTIIKEPTPDQTFDRIRDTAKQALDHDLKKEENV